MGMNRVMKLANGIATSLYRSKGKEALNDIQVVPAVIRIAAFWDFGGRLRNASESFANVADGVEHLAELTDLRTDGEWLYEE
jgi:hypothetical protein